jgi:hypothetical protein
VKTAEMQLNLNKGRKNELLRKKTSKKIEGEKLMELIG